MERNVARIGSWAGWLSVTGIIGYHLTLTVLAGQRVSGTDNLSEIAAYYRQPIVAVLGIEQILVVIPVAFFAVVMRQTLAATAWTRLWATVGFVALIVELPLILTEIAAQAGLVSAVSANESVSGLFRFWDVLYNSGVYAFEATWVFAFGVAVRSNPIFPRYLVWLSPLTAALLGINVFAIWVGIPDAATLPSAVLISAWLVGASIGLGRMAGSRAIEPVTEPAGI